MPQKKKHRDSIRSVKLLCIETFRSSLQTDYRVVLLLFGAHERLSFKTSTCEHETDRFLAIYWGEEGGNVQVQAQTRLCSRSLWGRDGLMTSSGVMVVLVINSETCWNCLEELAPHFVAFVAAGRVIKSPI